MQQSASSRTKKKKTVQAVYPSPSLFNSLDHTEETEKDPETPQARAALDVG
jgi:hypothetical protein